MSSCANSPPAVSSCLKPKIIPKATLPSALPGKANSSTRAASQPRSAEEKAKTRRPLSPTSGGGGGTRSSPLARNSPGQRSLRISPRKPEQCNTGFNPSIKRRSESLEKVEPSGDKAMPGLPRNETPKAAPKSLSVLPEAKLKTELSRLNKPLQPLFFPPTSPVQSHATGQYHSAHIHEATLQLLKSLPDADKAGIEPKYLQLTHSGLVCACIITRLTYLSIRQARFRKL